jgi:GTP-binding protein
MARHVVAIVGRPNVGKSTLFNRLTGSRNAIVADVPGVTRDRNYRDVEWNRAVFSLIDTGGLFLKEREFGKQVQEQASRAIAESDLVVFLVDGRTGPTAEDAEIARLLQKSGKDTILTVNMIDNFKDSHVAYNFMELGLGEPVPISALNGLNIDTLLDRIVELLPQDTAEQTGEGIRVAVAGRPNVGKSSLVNAILKEKRLIVSDLPGTTRDAIDTIVTRGETQYVLVDTSGIKRRSRTAEGVEYYSMLRSLRAVDRADIALLVLDAHEGVVEQDKKIGGYIHEAGKGLIIIANKWDLITDAGAEAFASGRLSGAAPRRAVPRPSTGWAPDRMGTRPDGHPTGWAPDRMGTPARIGARKGGRGAGGEDLRARFERLVRAELDFIQYAPVHHVSSLTGKGVADILGLIDEVYRQLTRRIGTGNLNSWLNETIYLNPPPAVKGRETRIYYAAQVGVKPPTFVFFVNYPEQLHFSYKRHLERRLREAYGFKGAPLRLIFRRRRSEK